VLHTDNKVTVIIIITIILIITIFNRGNKFKQARVGGTGVARWGTWLTGKEKEVNFEAAFERTLLQGFFLNRIPNRWSCEQESFATSGLGRKRNV